MKNLRLVCGLLCLLSLPGCLTFGGAERGLGVLNIQNQRSGERSMVQYRLPNGELDPAGLWQLSYLMRDSNSNQAAPIDPNLLDFMADARWKAGLPPQTLIIVTSGYRAPSTNQALRRQNGQAAENSYHLRGQAVDIKIPAISGRRFANAAASLNRGGVAYYASNEHVHLDTGPPRSWDAR